MVGLTRLGKESARDDQRHESYEVRGNRDIESSEGSVKGSLAVNPSKHFSRG